MPLLLGQLIYTSFAKVGFQALVSAEVPSQIRENFIEQVVYQHWDSYNPPGADYRAAYLYQISANQTLFGWLYNDGTDDFARSHVPYFVCYYLAEALQSAHLKSIFTCLLMGPIDDVNRQCPPDEIKGIALPNEPYQSARPGIGIFAPTQEKAYLSVQQGKLVRMFVFEDNTGQNLEFATSISAECNSEEKDIPVLEEPKGLSKIIDGKQFDLVIPSDLHAASEAQDSSKVIDELITRSELEKIVDELITRSELETYQQILLSKLQSGNAARSWPVSTWKYAAVGVAALIVLMVSSVYLLRLLPNSIVQIPSSQNSITALENLILAKTFLDTAPVWSVVLSPDGQTMISGGANQTIKIWNIETGKILKTLSGHEDVVRRLVLTPDGKTLISGSGDRTIKLWDLQTNQLIQTLEQESPVWELALSPDGKTLFSGGEDGALKVWQISSGELLQTNPAHQSRIFSIAVSPDGKTVATASFDQTIKLWNAQTGALIRTMTGHTNAVRALAFSPDGTTIASASWDKTLKLWNWQTGELIRTFVGHEARVVDVLFSPDGQTLISGGVDNRINFWSVQDGTLLRSLSDHTDWVLSLALSPERYPEGQARQPANTIKLNRIVSSSKDQTIRIWQFR